MQHSLSSVRPTHGGNLTWAAKLAGCSPQSILDFSASINPLGPPASAIATIQAHLAHLRDYPDPSYTALRQALGKSLNLSPDWILPGNGAAELLTWVGRDLAEQGAVLLPTPAFGDYFRALRAFSATIVPYPLAIAPHPPILSTPEPFPTTLRGLLLNNPHNPTGGLFSPDQVRPYLEAGWLVVVDEAFMDFLPPDRQQSMIDWVPSYPNLVVLRSLTKFYSLPGLRLGYAIAHPDRLQRWQQWRDPWSVNSLAAAVGEGVLQDLPFQQQTWTWLDSARPHLYNGLKQLPSLMPFPGVANFLLVGYAGSTVTLQERVLRQSRILIRDCLSFPELGDRYFRVAIRTLEDNQRLLDGLALAIDTHPALPQQ